jgi:chemotaxis protein methyltransferase CheR
MQRRPKAGRPPKAAVGPREAEKTTNGVGQRMADQARIAFLKWCLPRLGLRWPGYRQVRRLVGKRLNRRLAELGLADLSAYRSFLISNPAEWARLDAMCRIPISRFYRDPGVFDDISREFLPEAAARAVARGDNAVTCWSVGCASGEEPYTLVMAWHFCVAHDWPALGFTVIATDAEETMIKRAKAACYGTSSLKDLPQEWLERAFTRRGPLFCLAGEFREGVRFELQDIRQSMPDGPFDLILCRNLVFTYFDEALQRRISDQLQERLRPGGCLVLGSHEVLPADAGGFALVAPHLPIYRREPPSPEAHGFVLPASAGRKRRTDPAR